MSRKYALFISLCLLSPMAFSGLTHEEHEHEAGQEALGQVHFPTSCSAATQAQFERDVAMLHSFWYEKAVPAFAQIAASEPSCAIAYWGMAMSLYHPLWDRPTPAVLSEGLADIDKGLALGTGTAREKDYLAAARTLFADTQRDYGARVLAYEQAMQGLHQRYPEDTEAGAFYALSLLGLAQASPPDKTYAREKQAAALLNAILEKEPDHPGAVHYLIHAYDSPPLAALALNAARSYARIAPAVPHALHMPSHIFTRLGLWQESVQSNIASEAAAKNFATQTHMDGAWDEQLHAMDYLMYAYLQMAEDGKARSVLDELSSISKVNPESFKAGYAFTAIPARYAIERRQWAQAAALQVLPGDYPWDKFPWTQANVYSARGEGAARSGDIPAAQQAIDHLVTIRDGLVKDNDSYWATQVDIQRLAVSGWLAHAQKHDDKAVEYMRAAADREDASEKHPVTPGPIVPAREMLGDLLLDTNRPADALREYETSLAMAPNRFGGLAGAARAASLSGDAAKARGYYTQLLAICTHADADRAELREAKAYLSKATGH